jgi:hypothetical protein
MVNIFSVLINIMIRMSIVFKQTLEVLLEQINVDLIQFLMGKPGITILMQLQQNEELGSFNKTEVFKRKKVYLTGTRLQL